MNVSKENPIKNFERKLKIGTVVFSIILLFGAASYAQNINDDLKPKETSVKSKSIVKTPSKTVKKTVSQSKKKTGGTKSKTPASSQSRSYSSETSNQILNRYMSFQQTASVTNRDWNSVVAQSAKTLQDNPNHSVAKAQSLIAQGQIAYNQRKYSMAIIHFKEALQILPESSLPHYGLGRAYLANGQAKAAENSFEAAINQNKNFALAYKGIGDAAAAQGERKKAEKYYKKATEIGVKEGNMMP